MIHTSFGILNGLAYCDEGRDRDTERHREIERQMDKKKEKQRDRKTEMERRRNRKIEKRRGRDGDTDRGVVTPLSVSNRKKREIGS